jgi:uncharacterized phage-associated protein
MAVPYTPLAIANEFIARCPHSDGIEHMKLQKLVYCANGWSLAFHIDAPLVDEPPEVWKFGPVFPTLYRALKVFGRSPIKYAQSRSPFERPDRVDEADEETLTLIRWTWDRYGHLSSFALSDMTHRPGTAWHRLASEHSFLVPNGLDIPNNYIAEEFRGIYESESRQQAS